VRHSVRPKTLQSYQETITRHLLPTLCPIPVQALTAATVCQWPSLRVLGSHTVQTFYAQKLRDGTGPWTMHFCHQRLAQALKQAVRLGIVNRNVCELVTSPRVPRREMITWTAEQARRFLAVARGSGYGPIWLLALGTGMRRGELLGLRWQDVDLDKGLIAIRQTVGLLNGRPEFKPPKQTFGDKGAELKQGYHERRRRGERQERRG